MAGVWLVVGGAAAGLLLLSTRQWHRGARPVQITGAAVDVASGVVWSSTSAMREAQRVAGSTDSQSDRHDRYLRFVHEQFLRQSRQAKGMSESLQRALALIERCAEQAATDPEFQSTLHSAIDQIGKVEQHMRQASSLFADVPIYSGDPHHSFEALTQRTEEASLLRVTLRIDADLNRYMSQMQDSHATQVVREALSNVIAHARAHSVALRATVEGRRLVISVSDDGQGFDVRATRANHPEGWLKMQAHAEAANGLLQVESAPGAGTVVTLTMPLI